MGFKKIAKVTGKSVGTILLTATGAVSAILETSAQAVGNDKGASTFGSAKRASFKSIKKMWSNKKKANDFTNHIDSVAELETLRNARDGYLNMANASKTMAEKARQNGNEEKERK